MSYVDIFQCPKCLLPLERSSNGMACQNCGQIANWDGLIMDFSTQDLYWSYIPRPLANQLVESAKTEGADSALEKVLTGVDYKDFLIRMLDERRGDFRFVLPTAPRGCILDLGSGWGANTLALSQQFQTVVAVDGTKENLRFSACRIRDAGRSNVHFVSCDPLETVQLPFREGVFDAVILSGVLEWIGTGSPDNSPRELQLRLLRQLKRLLKPNGCLYLGIENRYYALYWFGKPDPHARFPFLSVLPRKLADLVSRLVKGKPYRTYIYSYRGLKKLLREAGYPKTEFYTPVPSYHEPRAVLPLENKKGVIYWVQTVFLPLRSAQALQAAALRTLARLNSLQTFAADFAVIAGSEQRSILKTYLCSELKEHLNNSAGPEQLHMVKADDHTRDGVSLFVFEQNAALPTFRVKVLRDPADVATLDREFKNLTWLRHKLKGNSLLASIPQPLARFDLDGFPFLVTTVVPGKPLARFLPRNHSLFPGNGKGRRSLTKAADWLLAFQEATVGCEVPFETDSLERQIEELGKLPIDTAAHVALVKQVSHAIQDMRYPSTVAHGNLAVTNILLHGETIGAVDWADLREKSQPLGDFFHLFLSAAAWMDDGGAKHALHELLGPSTWLHDVFRTSLARHCERMHLEPRLIPAYLRAYSVQRLELATELKNVRRMAEELQFLDSTFEQEKRISGLVRKGGWQVEFSESFTPKRQVFAIVRYAIGIDLNRKILGQLDS